MLNLHAEKMVEMPKVLHREFLLQSTDGAVQKTRRRGSEDDIINIE